MIVKISKQQAVNSDWEHVRTWNYKIKSSKENKSIVIAELEGEHGEVHTNENDRIYYILDGEGEFQINGENIKVSKEDLVIIPPNTNYNYWAIEGKILKVILFMELWEV